MSDFTNKTVMIIGATGGIGQVVSKRMNESGANLLLFSRNEEKLKNLKEELNSNTEIFVGDALSKENLDEAVAKAVSKFGSVDVLIHAVGSIVLKSLHSTNESTFREVIDLNLVSPFLALNSVIPHMLKQKSGSIVVTSSVAGSKGLMNHEAISAAKGGLEAMVRSASVTYAKRGIRVNGVSMGLVDTPLAKFLTGNELAMKASVNMHPMSRIGNPDDVVDAISYLASNGASWTTGAIIPIDGGMKAN
jgi:NAD(P)-dependent dehydrogenase (short-subunit alcohol dehydrogenase family)